MATLCLVSALLNSAWKFINDQGSHSNVDISLCVQIKNAQSALITWENEKCSRKNTVAHINSKMGEVDKMSSIEFLEYSQ